MQDMDKDSSKCSGIIVFLGLDCYSEKFVNIVAYVTHVFDFVAEGQAYILWC